MSFDDATETDPSQAYLAAIGRALYALASLDWLVIEVITRLDPTEDIPALAAGTTHAIYTKFRAESERSEIAQEVKTALIKIADGYSALPPLRNAIAHARRATTPDGKQRLYRWAPTKEKNAFWIDETFLAKLENRATDVSRELSSIRTQLPDGPFQRRG